jgi:hypothetical protein
LERAAGLDPGLAESFRRGEARHQRVFLAGLQGNDVDFRVERLTERRQDVKTTQPGRLGRERRSEPDRGRKHG